MSGKLHELIEKTSSTHFIVVIFITSFLGVFLILLTTSPLQLGPQGMLLAYGSFYLFFFTTILLSQRVYRLIRNNFRPRKSPIVGLRYGISVMLAAVTALGLLIVLALQSIGQLDVKSLFLVGIFEIIACFYVIKRA